MKPKFLAETSFLGHFAAQMAGPEEKLGFHGHLLINLRSGWTLTFSKNLWGPICPGQRASLGMLGRSLGVLGRSLGVLERSRDMLGRSLDVLGRNLRVLGRSLGVLGRSLGVLGRSLGVLGRSLGAV